MSTQATLHVIGGLLDGQQASSCPSGYHLQSFFFQKKQAFAFVAAEASFEDARMLLIGRTRTAAAPPAR